MGRLNHDQRQFFYSFSLEEAVPGDHPVRAIAAEQGFCRTCEGGSILLETMAPPEAIICAPAMFGDRYAEQEYVVDRRRLTGVKVV